MSGLIKNTLKLPILKSAGNVFGRSQKGAARARSMWTANPVLHQKETGIKNVCALHTNGSCLLNKAAAQPTAGERELADFLNEEIAAERKLQKVKNIPTEVDGFKVVLDESEVSLIKTTPSETIEVNFNINHSVDTDAEPEINPNADKPELGEMKSKPTFEVEIKRGAQTLGFTCTIVTPSAEPQESDYNDLFTIDEVVMYDGEWKDNNYAVSGEVLDGTLYDLMMNLLEDKGITNDFVEKVIDFSTAYEHSKYISLLERVQKFVSPK
ncbi:hypothetical protein GE061_018210 [Apolygus lucorum]|uniref:Complement component 1 Q subcomponent-binding protein, mitochondrial n=3 Tax=Apolygus lucorum TaxID=248454 RepID=A0A8S9XDD0_APOLU|nr:hypothetical protein GE061_018210 [Apolygus lucorum]